MSEHLIDDLLPLPEPEDFGYRDDNGTWVQQMAYDRSAALAIQREAFEAGRASALADRALRGDGKGEFFKLTRYGPTIRADVAEEAIAKGIEVNLVGGKQ